MALSCCRPVLPAKPRCRRAPTRHATEPAEGTHWSTRRLAAQLGMSQSAVSRIWRAFGLQPHRVETCKLSKGPLVIDTVRDVVGLYLNPPDRALDNASTHKTPLIHRWLVQHPRVHLHCTPTSASWLNLGECWSSILQRRELARGQFRSTDALEATITGYLTNVSR